MKIAGGCHCRAVRFEATVPEAVEIRRRMNLSLSCDHRVVDGWDAANFMQDLKKLIENPLKLLSA